IHIYAKVIRKWQKSIATAILVNFMAKILRNFIYFHKKSAFGPKKHKKSLVCQFFVLTLRCF
ncbi:MAG: hypothetical protein K2J94_04235, partial [Duncaniella sp.]|nr:hypothetical protein [Duncaniella sp.]